MIRLEPLAESHLDALAALVDDPDVQRFTRVPVPTPSDFPRTWLRLYEDGRGEGTREEFAVVDGDDGTFLGVGVAPRIDREGGTAELGYVVAPAARGRGVATQALRLLTEWAFSELGALRLELLISVDNEASKHVAERCGYVREGVLRSVHFKQNLREDTEIWSRLPGDPGVAEAEAAVRDALVALDAAFERRDFDAVLDLCTDDVVFIGSGEGEEAVGRDAILTMLEAIAPQAEGAEFTLVWDSVDVEIRGDVALLVAWGAATLVTPRRADSFRYRLTGVLLRSGHRWLWRIHHGSEPAAW